MTASHKASPFTELTDGSLHIWIFALPQTPGQLDVERLFISEEEWAALAAESSSAETLRRTVSRSYLRRLLSGYTGLAPEKLRFTQNEHGKPYLQKEFKTGIYFNTTHAGQWGLAALCRAGDVGIDIEKADPHRAWQAIADTYFTDQERGEIDARPADEHHAVFYTLWTSKEACAKATGRGLMTGEAPPEIRLTPDGPQTQLPFRLLTWEAVTGYPAAVAYPHDVTEVRHFVWDDNC